MMLSKYNQINLVSISGDIILRYDHILSLSFCTDYRTVGRYTKSTSASSHPVLVFCFSFIFHFGFAFISHWRVPVCIVLCKHATLDGGSVCRYAPEKFSWFLVMVKFLHGDYLKKLLVFVLNISANSFG